MPSLEQLCAGHSFVDWSRNSLELSCIIYRVLFAFTFLRDRAALKAMSNGDPAASAQPLKAEREETPPWGQLLYSLRVVIYLFIHFF